MKIKNTGIAVWVMALSLYGITTAHAGVNINLTGPIGNAGGYGGLVNAAVIDDFKNQLSQIWDSGSALTADAFAMANYFTSTTGQAKIDNITLGLMFSPTFATTANAIDSGMKDSLAAAKGGGFNMGLLVGFSLGSKADLIFHGMYIPEAKYIKQIDRFSAFGGGFKLRFKIIGSAKAVGTGLDGLTLSLSGGYSRTKLKYSTALNQSAQYEALGIAGTLTFSDFNGEAKIQAFYAGVDLKIYFRLLHFLTLYGGAGVIWDYSTITIDALGTANNTLNSVTQNGTVGITADTKSSRFIPHVTVGLCFNIAFIKIPVQLSMTWSKENKTTPIWNLTGGVAISF